jgi:hypothetical protein
VVNPTRYTAVVEHNGIAMTPIGHWIDLARYYAGSDGNAWCWHSSGSTWTNRGAIEAFRAAFREGKYRGELYP